MPDSNVKVELLPSYGDLPLISYQTEGSAGFDFYAAIEEPITIQPGNRTMISTGLKFAIPHGLEMQVRPRSGLAAKEGLTVLNSPGTVDSDYRGEVKIILINLSDKPFTVQRGMRIAQGVISSYIKANLEVVVALDETQRGSRGFGHTGI